MSDPAIASLITRIQIRSAVGRAKYGADFDRTCLPEDERLRYLQEELLDTAVFIERILIERSE